MRILCPIFGVAYLGVVGDFNQIVPLLNKRLQKKNAGEIKPRKADIEPCRAAILRQSYKKHAKS